MNHLNYQEVTINGTLLKSVEMLAFCRNSNVDFLREIGFFLEEWLQPSPVIQVQTSGSTGAPKTMEVCKSQMLQSAAATAQFFNFERGQTALLCLPVHYIAGKMMIVRALLSGLNLICIPPSAQPLSHFPTKQKIDFAPLTPMQLQGVSDAPMIKTVLLGGGPVSPALEDELQSFSSAVFHGYGMTETLSHVALRRVNGAGRSEVYAALPGVKFSLDERECLIIQVPFLDAPVVTNDVVELLNETAFIWKGRADHVINSGGIKLFPEEIERKLSAFIKERFFVAGLPDEMLGEMLVLVIESDGWTERLLQELRDLAATVLNKYEQPKQILFTPEFSTTASGKVQRGKTVEQLKKKTP